MAYSNTTGTLSLAQASIAASGYLGSSDWAAFNGKQTALATATSAANGYHASNDWIAFNGKQSALGFIPMNKTGDTMTGALNLVANGLVAGTSQLVLTGGNVGIGTVNPITKLQVIGGQAVGSFLSSSNGTSGSKINWNAGNVQMTDIAAGTLYLDDTTMVDGGAYTLILTNATGGSYTLSAGALTFKCNRVCPISVIPGSFTVLSMLKAGSYVMVSWNPSFK